MSYEKIDTLRLGKAIMMLTKGNAEDDPEPLFWTELAEIATSPAAEEQVILGLLGVSVHALRKTNEFADSSYFGLSVKNGGDDSPYVPVGQMLTAILNDQKATAVAVCHAVIMRGIDWADDVMVAAARTLRMIMLADPHVSVVRADEDEDDFEDQDDEEEAG